MENLNSKKDYIAPRAKVIEEIAQSVLCGSIDGMNSNGGIEPYEREEYELD